MKLMRLIFFGLFLKKFYLAWKSFLTPILAQKWSSLVFSLLFTNYLETRVRQANEIDVVKYFYSNFKQSLVSLLFKIGSKDFFFWKFTWCYDALDRIILTWVINFWEKFALDTIRTCKVEHLPILRSGAKFLFRAKLHLFSFSVTVQEFTDSKLCSQKFFIF